MNIPAQKMKFVEYPISIGGTESRHFVVDFITKEGESFTNMRCLNLSVFDRLVLDEDVIYLEAVINSLKELEREVLKFKREKQCQTPQM